VNDWLMGGFVSILIMSMSTFYKVLDNKLGLDSFEYQYESLLF